MVVSKDLSGVAAGSLENNHHREKISNIYFNEKYVQNVEVDAKVSHNNTVGVAR